MPKITQALARGYGLSFRDGTERFKDGIKILTGKEKKATLHLVVQDDGIKYPIMVDEKNEGTICLAFYVYWPEFGWKQVKLAEMCQTIEIDGAMPLVDVVNADVTRFEKIEAWPRPEGRRGQ